MDRGYNSENANTTFKIYILATLFLGTSVLSFLHLPYKQDSFFLCMHYIALPFLLISFLSNRHEKKTKVEHFTILVSFVYLIINRILLGRSASFGFLVNILYEPIFLLSILFAINEQTRTFLRNTIVVFFIIECVVGLYEAITQQLVFMRNTDIFEIGEFGVISVRAYSLHGHPLSNASLVVALSVIFLFSDMKALTRYLLFCLGLLSVFAFNTRSALLIMIVSFCLYIITNLKVSIWKMTISLVVIAIPLIYYILPYFESIGIGNRFSISMDSDDGSSMARWMIIAHYFNMSLDELLLGISPEEIKSILKTTGLVAVENSILNVFFAWGIPFGIIYFYSLMKMFLRFKPYVGRSLLVVFLISFFMLLNVNNVIQTFTPLIPVCLMALCAFKKTDSLYV